MTSADLFDLKDTISECSMDSAYQSQTGASRRGTRKPDGYSQDSRRVNTHFNGNEMFSPSMSSDSYSVYPEQSLDLTLPPAAGSWEAPEASAVYANYSAGQEYSQYSTANYTPTSTISMSSPWVPADAQFQSNPFAFSYPANQPTTDMMYTSGATPQRQWSNGQFDNSERPTPVRNSSSYTLAQDSRQTSAHESNYGGFVATPTSTTSIHFPHTVDFEPPQLVDARYDEASPSRLDLTDKSRNDLEDSTSTSMPPNSLEDTEGMTPSDIAESKLEEERTKVARSHPLYQQLPDKDGKYHCPEEGKAGCTHKPTPLKCNYDKYVDSHLKPFRCNKKSCVGVQFSSTACLLRHEREAHGMHGHGARPHLCHFTDCERAVPGHGFPRRYNLFDHMKRVHQYDGPTTEPSPPTSAGAQRKPVSRKRKASTEEIVEKRQKVTKPTAEQVRQQQREALAKEFMDKRQHIIDILSNLSSPNDLRDDIELTKEVVGLHDICSKFRSHGG